MCAKICTASRARKRNAVEHASERKYRAEQTALFRAIKRMAIAHRSQVLAVALSKRGGLCTVLLPLLVRCQVLSPALARRLIALRRQRHPSA
eukprot:m51a1_g6076 hypothetical protein (92) ;mRNA; r:300632-301060